MVAAFIKKFARLSCFAPPGAITFILPIIYNLLRSHHKCIQMIHKPKISDEEVTGKIIKVKFRSF